MDQNLALSPEFPNRLPKVGTTVFTVLPALAAKHQAIRFCFAKEEKTLSSALERLQTL
jgi:hypothetical protein